MNTYVLKDVLKQTMIAAIYVVLVYVFAFASFGLIQFRIAEVLMILVLFDKKSIVGLTMGCFIANWLGGAIIIDIIIGPLATLLAGVLMHYTKEKVVLAMVWPAIANGIIIGLILTYGYQFGPLFFTIPSVFIGEAAVMYLVGLPIYYVLRQNKGFMEFFKG
jgi:uncharacterized membrane protein